MFTLGHIIWVLISLFLTILGFLLLNKIKPDINKLLKFSFVFCFISEIIKYFHLINILPIVDITIKNSQFSYTNLGRYTPYINMSELPFELCSLQIFFILAMIVSKNDTWKNRWCSIIYVTGVMGGVLAILFPAPCADYTTINQFFGNIRMYQFFIHHIYILVLGLYLGFNNEYKISPKMFKDTILILLVIDLPSFYINSIFSQPFYKNEEPVAITYLVNFLSSYQNPIGLVLTEKWQWICYLVIRALVVTCLIYLLLFISSQKNSHKKNTNSKK